VTEERELQAFIARSIKSVWAMELLLLLQRDPDRCWQEGELVYEMRASAAVVGDILGVFQRDGLVASGEHGWRFSPVDPPTEARARMLAKVFQERPIATMRMIVTPDSIQSLSDAFKLKGED